MSFTTECGCTAHEQFSAGKEFKVLKLAWNKIRRPVINALIENGMLAKSKLALCTACAEYAENTYVTPKLTTGTQTAQAIADDIRAGRYTADELRLIASALGQAQQKEVYDDTLTVGNQYKSTHYLQKYDAKVWLHGRNQILVHFLKGVCNIEGDEVHHKKLLILARAIEHIYGARNLNMIGPLSFTINLMSYYMTGSKLVCNANVTSGPSGSYSTILTWITAQAAQPPECPREGDITFFDNNQILARNWRVRFDAKALVSVVTTMLHILPTCDSHLQRQADLCPGRWRKYGTEHLCKVLPTFTDPDFASFRHYRRIITNLLLQQVASEQTSCANGSRDMYDETDLPVDRSSVSGTGYSLQRDDTTAKIRIVKTDNHTRNYTIVEGSDLLQPGLVVGDPVSINPCSYAAMSVVLKKIMLDARVGTDRQWTIVGCDGLPYNLASRVMQSTYSCPICSNVDLNGADKFSSHMSTEHNMKELPLSDHLTFGSVLLLPGPGHMEINMVKCCLKDLALMLNYRSLRAQAACEKANDHNKAWQMIQILLWGTGQELMVPFVRACVATRAAITVDGFFTWLSLVKDPNYVFMMDIILTYVMALHLFRCGLRRGNTQLVRQCYARFSDLFYVTNMTQYQELTFREHATRMLSPPPVQSFIDATNSLSASGNPCRGEGGDFLLEAKNRRIKMWMPPGLPTPSHWERVCRNLDRLDAVRARLFSLTGTTEEHDDYVYDLDLSVEIRHWRHILRRKQYLMSPLKFHPHKSISGLALDPQLSDFASLASQAKRQYADALATGAPLGTRQKMPRIYILQGDREKAEDVSRKTNKELLDLIACTIARIRDIGAVSVADSLDKEFQKDVKTGTKHVLLTFLQTVNDNHAKLLQLLEDEDT